MSISDPGCPLTRSLHTWKIGLIFVKFHDGGETEANMEGAALVTWQFFSDLRVCHGGGKTGENGFRQEKEGTETLCLVTPECARIRLSRVLHQRKVVARHERMQW